MMDLNVLKELRSKEELVNYFAKKGQNITEEKIDKLKKEYLETENVSNALSLKQLDGVVGGVKPKILKHEVYKLTNPEATVTNFMAYVGSFLNIKLIRDAEGHYRTVEHKELSDAIDKAYQTIPREIAEEELHKNQVYQVYSQQFSDTKNYEHFANYILNKYPLTHMDEKDKELRNTVSCALYLYGYLYNVDTHQEAPKLKIEYL